MYLILGTYRGQTEEIDTADTLQEACYLAREYQMAFGPSWSVSYVLAKN